MRSVVIIKAIANIFSSIPVLCEKKRVRHELVPKCDSW